MELKDKKEHILRCVKLGMELYKAQLCAECTEEEIELLSGDVKFLARVEQQYALEEYNLLLKHNTALEVSKMKGSAGPIQWRLEKLNSEKYGSKENKEKGKGIPVNLNVSLVGKNIEDTGN